MNTLLSVTTDHPPHTAHAPARVRRVGLLDRLALHAGLALITWGRRPVRERRATPVEHRLVRLAREQRDHYERAQARDAALISWRQV
jgi:hypothetical protein